MAGQNGQNEREIRVGEFNVIVGIKNWQDKGKTVLAVGTALELVLRHGYSFDEITANLNLTFPVYPRPICLNNEKMREYIKDMVETGIRHKIVIIDEADRVFPARFWQRHEQTDALIGLWQDYKLFNYIIYTAHRGTGTDVILREVTQIELEPEYDETNDCIPFTIYNALDGRVSNDCLLDVSKNVFPYYNRWEIIK